LLLPVRSGDKMGYIDGNGKIILPVKYESASDFTYAGMAVVSRDHQYTLIDKSGKELLPKTYDYIQIVDDRSFAVLQDTSWGLWTVEGGLVLAPIADEPPYLLNACIIYKQEEKYGVCTKQGKKIVDVKMDTVIGFPPVFIEFRSKEEFVLADTSGRVLITTTYDSIQVVQCKRHHLIYSWTGKNFQLTEYPSGKTESLKITSFSPSEDRSFCFMQVDSGAAVYVDSLGLILSNKAGVLYEYFSQTLILKTNAGLQGLMDTRGSEIMTIEYEDISPAEGDFLWVKKSGLWGTFSFKGKKLADCKFDEIFPFEFNLAQVRKGKLFGLINIAGELCVAPNYIRIDISKGKGKLYLSNTNIEIAKFDRFGTLLDKNDFGNLKTIRVGAYYENKDGQLLNSRGGSNLWNGIDTSAYKYGWFYLPEKKKWGMKDTTGKIIIPAVYNGVQVYDSLGLTMVWVNFKEKNFLICGSEVKRDRKYGIVNHKLRRIVLPATYLTIFMEDFFVKVDAVARTLDYEGGFKLVARNGIIKGGTYTYIGDFHNGLARVNKGGRYVSRVDSIMEVLPGCWNNVKPLPLLNDYKCFYSGGKLYCLQGKWGWVNRMGEEVISVQYQYGFAFTAKRAIVKLKYKWGVIDTTGKEIVKIEYNQVTVAWSNTVAKDKVKDSLLFLLRKDLNKQGFINTSGTFITDMKYQQARDFKGKFAAVMIKGKWGFIDTSGKEICPFVYDKAEDFINGFAAVKKKSKWGFIDENGSEIGEIKYMDVGSYHDGLAWMVVNGKYGFLDEQGNEVIPPGFSKCSDFYYGLAPAMKENQWGFIDKNGKWIIKPKYKQVWSFTDWNVAMVKTDEGYGLVKNDGKEILPPKNSFLGTFVDGLARFRQDNKYGYIDNLGNVAIPAQYIEAQDFSEGIAAVSDGTSWFYITTSGAKISEQTFSSLKPFVNGYGIISTKGKFSFMDVQGNIIPLRSGFRPAPFSEDGFSVVVVSKKGQTFVNKNGKPVVKSYYRNLKPFYNGRAPVRLTNKWGLIDKMGYCVTGYKFDDAGPISSGLTKVRIVSYYGIADTDGKIIIPAEFEIVSKVANMDLFYLERKGTIGYLRGNGTWLWEPK
jgi:hypothetical protein